MTMRILALIFLLFTVADSAEAADEIRIGFPSVGTLISGQVGTVLQNTDILQKHGFKGTIRPLALGKELKTALVSERLDIILTSEANFLVLAGQGFECQAIASLGSGGKMGLVVKKDSSVKKVADLKGKKIGTLFGTSLHRPALQWVKEAGLDPLQDVSIVNIPEIGAMRASLFTGDLDAIVDLDPHLYENIRKGKLTLLQEDSIELVAVASAKYLKQNPGAIPRIRKALAEASFYLASNKEKVNGWYAKLNNYDLKMIDAASRANRNYLASSLANTNVAVSGELRKKLDLLGSFLVEQKLIKNRPDLSQTIAP